MALSLLGRQVGAMGVNSTVRALTRWGGGRLELLARVSHWTRGLELLGLLPSHDP